MGKKSKKRKPLDERKVKKVFLVDNPGNPVNFTCDRKTSLRLLLGFKYSNTKKKFLITTDYYVKEKCTKRCPNLVVDTEDESMAMSKLLKQKIGVQASSPPRNEEDKDELSAASTGATKTWIDNLQKGEIINGVELNKQLGFSESAGSSSTNVLPKYDSMPRSTLTQDKLQGGLSPVVGNIKIHPGMYKRPEEQEPTRKEAKVKPRPAVIEQHCQEPITKQIKKLLLQKTKTGPGRTRKSHTWQETKPNLGKEGRTVASETPQGRKKKQPPCLTGVLTSGKKISCPQREKGTESMPQKKQKMGPSTPVTPSQESEEIWDLDKALEFIEGAPLSDEKFSKIKKKLAEESGEKEPMVAQSEVAVSVTVAVNQQGKHGDLVTQDYQDSPANQDHPAVSTSLVSNCLLQIYSGHDS